MSKRHSPQPATLAGSGGVKIVFEDEALLAVAKPAGLPAAPPRAQEGSATVRTLQDAVWRHVRGQMGSRATVWQINRIESGMSGLVLYAKTHAAHRAMNNQISNQTIAIRYVAVVEGEIQLESGQLAAELAGTVPIAPIAPPRRRESPTARTPRPADPAKTAKPDITCEILTRQSGRSLLRIGSQSIHSQWIEPALNDAGHPPVSTTRPRTARPSGGPSGPLAIHVWSAQFIHPATRMLMEVSCPPPAEFFQWTQCTPEILEQPAKKATRPAQPTPRPQPARPARPARPADAEPAEASEGWNHVAQWYEGLVSQERSDYHEQLIVPGMMRLLGARKGQRVLDIACGEGVMARRLAERGVHCVGVDAAGQLIEAARRLARPLPAAIRPEFHTGDARALDRLEGLAGQAGSFDAAMCVLALMNIDPFEPVLRGAAALLKPGGRLTAVILHPAFRNAPYTSWGWEGDQPAGKSPGTARTGTSSRPRQKVAPDASFRQYRRVEAYLSSQHREIVMNPGEAAHGKAPITTTTWHRPIQTYIDGFARAGLLIDALEEWASHRTSEKGPRAAELDRSRREIPLFLALRGRKV